MENSSLNTLAEEKKSYDQLLLLIREEVYQLFDKSEDECYVYHSIKHTEYVAKAAAEIANHFQLSERDFFVVLAAAWFHDIGYLIDCHKHESEGAQKSAVFLERNGVPQADIKAITGCILATKLPQSPDNLLEKIVCDADFYHLGTDQFLKNNMMLLEEVRALKSKEISEEKWRKSTVELIKKHHYHTDYCRLLLNDKKKRNLDSMQNDFKEKNLTKEEITEENNNSDKEEKKKKKPKKGIETMFKVASNSNQKLSKLADYKARNMITVNSIILSAVISLLLKQLDIYSYLTIPTYMLLLVSVVTLVFAVLATRPSVAKGKFNMNDIKKNKVNLLFFGNFYKMDLETYDKAMWELMDDYDLLYSTLIKDVYFQGVVLARKYKLLRISYNVFMFGLILSVLAFIVATMI